MGLIADNIRLKAINHITYNVRDKDIALKWYEEVLGVKQIRRWSITTTFIGSSCPAAPWSTSSKTRCPVGPVASHRLRGGDISAARDELQNIGVECTDIQTRHDGQQAFYFHDPDHNRLEICTKSGFGVLV